jgi:transposase
MQNQTIIGIDVSSATLDICVTNDQGHRSFVINNEVKAICQFFKSYKEQLIIGMENTGRYNWALYEALKETGHLIFVVSPLHLKKSMGLVRGKNDKIDAVRIAAFIAKNHNELPQWKPSSQAVQKLKILLTERNSRIKTKRQLLKQQYDYAKMKHLGMDKYLMRLNKQELTLINKQINLIEQDIEILIKANEPMHSQAKLIRSVPGAGKVLCWMMLAKTESFTTITEPRKWLVTAVLCLSQINPGLPSEAKTGCLLMLIKRSKQCYIWLQ